MRRKAYYCELYTVEESELTQRKMLRPNTAEVKGVPNISNNMQAISNNARHLNGNSFGSVGQNQNHLPKQFIASMKTLFDILDDKHTGFVRYSDIEKGWQDDGCKGLPRGVLDSLSKLTPTSGLLSFERFCAGLKLCLLRNQADTGNVQTNLSSPLSSSKCKSPHRSKSPRPPSAPALEIENPLPNAPWNSSGNPTATVRPRNHIISGQRTLSLPQLSPDSSELDAEIATVNINTYNSPPPPPKPPRASVTAANSVNKRISMGNCDLDKSGIRHALQNWQMGLLLNEMDASDKLTTPSGAYYTNRGSADGGSSSATDSATSAIAFGTYAKKSCNTLSGGNSKRREPRRHTLQNGIDYNMLRRFKQYEEEREVLLLGLDAIEKTRGWYLQQLDSVQEKIRCLGRMGEHVDHWSEVQQEKINFQRARVLEINRSLAALADSWERGCFPLHFNLAISHSNRNLTSKTHMNSNSDRDLYLLPPNKHLRHQSRHVNNDPEIKRLEQENQALLRELFELRQCTPNRRVPPRVLTISQTQSSPVCSTSSGGGGLVDADVVY